MLGHIVSKEGVKIDPKRVEVINNISLLRNKNEIHIFLERINFLRRFIHNYAKIVKEIINLLRKGKEVKWTLKSRDYFSRIKRDFGQAPMLVNLNYENPFLIFYFASPTTIAFVLL